MNFTTVFVGAAFAALMSATLPANATQVSDDKGTCTKLNCQSTILGGTTFKDGQSSVPWTVQVYSKHGQCLRLSVTDAKADLQMTVTDPGGVTYFNDDDADEACLVGYCPTIKIDETQRDGWYTVTVGIFNGIPGITSFDLAYGRYNSGNPNCELPTEPAFDPFADPNAGTKPMQ